MAFAVIAYALQIIVQLMYYAVVHIIIPLLPFAFYFMFVCIILTLIGNLSGILGFFLFMVLFYFYVKGIIFYQPPLKGGNRSNSLNN